MMTIGTRKLQISRPSHRKADQLSQNELSIELERRDLKPIFGLTMPKLQVELTKIMRKSDPRLTKRE